MRRFSERVKIGRKRGRPSLDGAIRRSLDGSNHGNNVPFDLQSVASSTAKPSGTSVSGESWSPLTDTKDDAKTVESGPPSLLFEKDLKLEALQKRFHALEETTAALKKLNEQRADERRELEDTAAALRKDCQRFSQEKQEMKEAVRVLQGECLQLCERNGELEEEIEVLKAELTIAKSRARKSGSKQSESSEIPGTVQSSYLDPLWLSVAAMGAVTLAAGAVAIVRSRS